jgi:DNA-binding CsgD family transcriptional regulator
VTTILQVASFGFDVGTGDLVRGLLVGTCLVTCLRETLLSPPELLLNSGHWSLAAMTGCPGRMSLPGCLVSGSGRAYITVMWPIGRPPQWVGREQELATLGAGIEALARGEGKVIWVEGEAGIGKSSLVAEALTVGTDPEWDVGWGVADRLTERLPLQVMLDCLRVRPGSPDPRRARAGDLLSSRRLGLFADGDASVAGVEVLVALADELSAAAPTVLVVDDLQWADEASLVVWHQLAASIDQLRLLLIGTCRPTPRSEVQQVRAAVVRRRGAVITLGPLPETDVAALVTAMVGAPPGDRLSRLTAQAAGNPLYVRELVDAVVRERALEIRPTAEVSVAREQLPASLTAVLSDRLSAVSAETAQMLRTGALLGGRFAVTDLAAVVRRPVSDLAAGLQEAVAAGILAGSGSELAFRHLLMQQALYGGMPTALSTALHAEAARELAAAGADALSVAQQLSAANRPGEGWARTWLIESAPAVVIRAPELAADLLKRELDEVPAGAESWDELIANLVWALLAAGSYQEAARQANRALTVMTDPVRRAETSWMMARAQVSAGDNDDAIATIQQALTSADLPGKWRARALALLAKLQRVSTGDLDAVEATAGQALAVAEEADDAFATAHALVDLWLTHGIRRDHAAALEYIDRALRALGDDSGHADLRSYALNVRVFTLQNLGRWPEAELALRQARRFAQRSGSPDQATRVTAAVLWYWLGQWDDALAELGSDETDAYAYLRERWPALQVHGVAALIAGRRDQRTTAGQHLRRGLAKVLPSQTLTDRENQDFLVAAHALALEQVGETRQAMDMLAGILPRRDGEMTLTHQWLPDVVRLALAVGDRPVAQAAAQACAAEAAAETWPARAAAASLRCQGLLESDPDRLGDAVAHYRTTGPAVELPAALEDLAVVLAEGDREEDARSALNEAISLYEDMQARWDIRRAGTRLRPYGIKRGARSPRGPRAESGWGALTPTEVKVAYLVAEGRSNPDVAAALFLSRNTVQTHVSHILTKLGAKGRLDIVREALRQGASP